MFSGLERHIDSRQAADLPGPHPAAVHHPVGDDPAKRALDRHDPAILLLDGMDWAFLEDAHAGLTGSSSQCTGNVGRIDASVSREMEGRLHITDIGQWPHSLHIARADFLALDSPALRRAVTATHLFRFRRGEG